MAKITNKILAIDLEATCWDHPPPSGMKREIIEIGICILSRVNPENAWKIVGSESLIVKPVTSTISPFCTSLTTLTQKDVEGGMDFFYACRHLENYYDSTKLPWCSWGDFDRIMFEEQCNSTKNIISGKKGVRYPFGPTHWNMKDMYSLLVKLDREIGMQEALKREGITFDGTPHRGVDDAYNLGRLLEKVLP